MSSFWVRLAIGLPMCIVLCLVATLVLWATNTTLPPVLNSFLFVGIGAGTAALAIAITNWFKRQRQRR